MKIRLIASLLALTMLPAIATAKVVDQGYETSSSVLNDNRIKACADAKDKATLAAKRRQSYSNRGEIDIGECDCTKKTNQYTKSDEHQCGVNWKVIEP